MHPLLKQLNDIEGLDSVSRWPLAIGWWILIAVGAAIMCGITLLLVYKIMFKRSWKGDALMKLADLEKGLTDATTRSTVIALSEYLRRIVLRRFSRNECAGLTGEAWLKWLTLHDPKSFDWEKNGTLLIDVPYAPEQHNYCSEKIKNLIQAARNWVK